MFGRSFSVFSPGSRSAMVPAPQPIILATAGLRIGTVTFNGTEINAGAAKTVSQFPAVAGSYWMPVAWSSTKNILVVHAPTNASFTLRYTGIAQALLAVLTPQVTTLGTRIDVTTDIAAALTPATNAAGRALEVIPSAANGAGSASNFVQFTIAAILCRAT